MVVMQHSEMRRAMVAIIVLLIEKMKTSQLRVTDVGSTGID